MAILRSKPESLSLGATTKATPQMDTLDATPGDIEAALERAAQLVGARRFDEAEATLRALETQGDADARFHTRLGQIFRAQGRIDDAVRALEMALALDPHGHLPRIYLGLTQIDRRDYSSALQAFEKVVEATPDDAEHRRLLAVAARRAGDFERALRELEIALRSAPNHPIVWADLAINYEVQNRLPEALAALERGLIAAGLQRTLVEAKIAHLRRRGWHADAAAWIQMLLASNPSVAWLHYQLGMTLQSSDRTQANTHFARARKLDPADARFIVAHADSLNRTRGAEEAECVARAYQLARKRLEMPDALAADARPLLGILLRSADFAAVDRLGDFESLGRTFAAAGQETALHLLLSQPQTLRHRHLLVDWHRACGARMVEAAALAPIASPPAPAIGGRAKIRVGLMSSDLRDHPVGHFVKPLIERYDRNRFEIHAYSWYAREPDPVADWFAGQVDAFRHHPQIASRDAAQLIADDRLDVLFDLGGSTDMNKLDVLAWKPAPRIVSWLGYPHSAGLATIDRILVDPFTEPRDLSLLAEGPFRVANSWVAHSLPDWEAHLPIDRATPQERTGRVTFGTMNNPLKFNRTLIADWARILSRSPDSRFLFVRPEGAVAPFREHVCARFEAHGVSRNRVHFAPVRGRHLPHYNEIDVALDTFPQTGGTTTCETLWMGVPVVSLVGEALFERLSYSNLCNAGLGELAVRTRDAYVEKALLVAADVKWRTNLRRTMRERLRAHPLGDGDAFTREFQAAVVDWMDEGRAGL